MQTFLLWYILTVTPQYLAWYLGADLDKFQP